MFHMPMSSPMMTTMFGFFAGACACAERGTAPAAISNNAAPNAPSDGRPGYVIAARPPMVEKFDWQIAGNVRGRYIARYAASAEMLIAAACDALHRPHGGTVTA